MGARTEDFIEAQQLVLAIGGKVHHRSTVAIEGAPHSKARPRFGKGGRAFTDKRDRQAEKRTSEILKLAVGRRGPHTGNVALACIFYRPNRQRIDADNLLKHICDSATGILWIDDSQVTAITAVLRYDPDQPRTILCLAEHESSMRRGTDDVTPCKVCGKPMPRPPGTTRKGVCSPECKAANAGYALLNEPVPCKQCGEPFVRTTRAQTLCSVPCRAEWFRDRRKETGKPRSRCEVCDVELTHWRGGVCRPCWRKGHRRRPTVEELPISGPPPETMLFGADQ